MLGEVMIQFRGKLEVGRNMRFGNNAMDKLNLPVPGSDGPATYDRSFLLFTRQAPDAAARQRFYLEQGDSTDLTRWRSRAAQEEVVAMSGGREMGLLWY